MNETDIRNLNKMAEHAALAISYCNDITCVDDLVNARQISDACVLNLIQIGEIAKIGLTDETKNLLKSIPWSKVQGLRNKLVHEYEGINFGLIFDIVKVNLPILVSEIGSLVNN